jgi:hypothetical protein
MTEIELETLKQENITLKQEKEKLVSFIKKLVWIKKLSKMQDDLLDIMNIVIPPPPLQEGGNMKQNIGHL